MTVQAGAFNPVILEPFILQRGKRVHMAGLSAPPVKIVTARIAVDMLEIYSAEALREAIASMFYVCSMEGADEFEVPLARIKEQPQVSSIHRTLWNASRALWLSENAAPLRYVEPELKKRTRRKLMITSREAEAIRGFSDAIAVMKERQGGEKYTDNMRAIKHMRAIVEKEAISEYPSVEQLRNCAQYLGLIAKLSSPSTLERIELEEIEEMIHAIIEMEGKAV